MVQFILYCICGGSGVLADLLAYYLLTEVGVWYQASNIIGYATGTIVSFFLNRAITFTAKDKVAQRLGTFMLVACVGFTASALVLFVLVEKLQLFPLHAKIISLPIVVLIQFFLNKRFTFSETAERKLTSPGS